MPSGITVGRLFCPGLAIIGAIIFYWAPFYVAKASGFIPLSLELTVADLMAESAPKNLFFWLSVLGFVLVLLSSVGDIDFSRNAARGGAIAITGFPLYSLWKIITDQPDDGSISPGWGLIAVLIIAGGIFAAAGKIQETSSSAIST